MKILGTGLSGLVGSRIVELLSSKYEFENISRTTGVDITNYSSLLEKIKSSKANIILHLAAKTNVDSCEDDKAQGENGEAWKINVIGTQNVVKAASETGKKVVYISTDFVFDGTKSVGESYTEDDAPNPINWYGQTKYKGEKIVMELGERGLVVRIAYPYRANFDKNDFVRGIISALESGKQIKGITNHIFCPTFIDDIVVALDLLVSNNSHGIYHVVGSSQFSPYDAANLICQNLDLDSNLITPTTREEFFANRAPRPYNLALKNDKITQLGVRMKSFEEGLKEIKYQISNIKNTI